ncbi:MAG: hypothetical protein PVI90_11745 [Desulfobacteraceae bacterium]|jgi:hypothetical protein
MIQKIKRWIHKTFFFDFWYDHNGVPTWRVLEKEDEKLKYNTYQWLMTPSIEL